MSGETQGHRPLVSPDPPSSTVSVKNPTWQCAPILSKTVVSSCAFARNAKKPRQPREPGGGDALSRDRGKAPHGRGGLSYEQALVARNPLPVISRPLFDPTEGYLACQAAAYLAVTSLLVRRLYRQSSNRT